MRLRLISILLGVIGLVCFSVSRAHEVTRSQGSLPDGKTDGTVNQWQESISELLDALDKRGVLRPPDRDARRRLIKALLASLTLDGHLTEDMTDPEERGETDTSFSALIKGANPSAPPLAYVRLDSSGMEESPLLSGVLGNDRTYQGVILDLRGTVAEGTSVPLACIQALANEKMFPMVVLINGDTARAAEYLASVLCKEHGATLMGEPTKGVPFASASFTLAGGETVSVPDIAAARQEGTYSPPAPLIPDITVKAPTPLPCHRNGEAVIPEILLRDDCIRRACDLLTAIAALQCFPGYQDNVPPVGSGTE